MYLVTHKFKELVRGLKKTQRKGVALVEDPRAREKKKKYCFVACMTGFKHPKRIVLDTAGIPGWLVCAWCMDKPVTEYWKPRVLALGKALGIRRESQCLERIEE